MTQANHAIQEPNDSDLRELMLGQYIPAHYHHQMLEDESRMVGFKSALEYLVPDGGKVVDLGAGTGVLSFFAAQKASKVYSVERQPEMVQRANTLLAYNGCAERVELVQGDAMQFLPPEPVDVVVCEMLHSALLREKQLQIIASFKQRYLERFGGPLPHFIPEATILGVEALAADFSFYGYQAHVSAFEDPGNMSGRYTSLADPLPYTIFQYSQNYATQFDIDLEITVATAGDFNALRFVTKNVLAINVDSGNTIDWFNLNLILPVDQSFEAEAGDRFRVSFSYHAGTEISDLERTIQVCRI